jgi:hypothetical protein
MMAKGKARTFGQDLMRGEHTVGGGKVKDSRAIKDHAWQVSHLAKPQAKVQRKSGIGTLGISRQAMEYAGGYTTSDGEMKSTSGTSIFDPVLCELAYHRKS